MSYGISDSDIVFFYNGMLPYFKGYERGLPYRLTRAMDSLKRTIRIGDNVLDIGCATGITSTFMAESGAFVTGVDISPDLIAYAQENNNHPNINYFVGNICNLPFQGKFDVVSMVDVIEHIPSENINQAVSELYRVCKPSGLVYINTPDKGFSDYIFDIKPEAKQIIENPYYPPQLLEIFYNHGFSLVKFDAYGTTKNMNEYNEYWFKRNGG